MSKNELKKTLASLFVPIDGDNDASGVCFRSAVMDKDNKAYDVYKAVSKAQFDSGLSHGFSYEIASRAVDILAEAEDWNNEDDIIERVDSAVPIYTGELMEIYQANSWAIDEAVDDLGGNEHDAMTSDRRAATGWYCQIRNMVEAIKTNIESITVGSYTL